MKAKCKAMANFQPDLYGLYAIVNAAVTTR